MRNELSYFMTSVNEKPGSEGGTSGFVRNVSFDEPEPDLEDTDEEEVEPSKVEKNLNA